LALPRNNVAPIRDVRNGSLETRKMKQWLASARAHRFEQDVREWMTGRGRPVNFVGK
jgi:hypothetical protein